ncbi:HK97 gp10 family phage protein [Gracilibacillus caseinilyticus]|uniref:HK97 gp10 family phage protein n=1 Tax=Gracilibacillus caseinilyticus TaxID=2932256 RepID=A0ABY4ETI8_9BACI|nr:HK97 gp10 family phage protein [Gracilibacillus caseinilyticus]UOQ47739.1 HK97 gp10 family phage protein [Gracilibacillus caseinilyticus]
MYKSNAKKFQKEMKQKREETAKIIGVFAEAESKLRTPVKTGNLRRNTTHDIDNQENKSVIKVGSNVEYDPVIELGSVSQNIPAQPHHRPAIEDNKNPIANMIKKGLSFK